MRGAATIKEELPSVFVARLRTDLNEAGNERDLRRCADMLNSHQFERLPYDDQIELSTLYAERHLKITGALLG